MTGSNCIRSNIGDSGDGCQGFCNVCIKLIFFGTIRIYVGPVSMLKAYHLD